MRRIFFIFNFFLLSGCFGLSNVHAIDQTEVRLAGTKRLRQIEQGEDQSDPKRLKTVSEKHPAEIPSNLLPYSTRNFTVEHLEDIWSHISSHFPPNKIYGSSWRSMSDHFPPNRSWKYRSVSRDWKNMVNNSIIKLDLSLIEEFGHYNSNISMNLAEFPNLQALNLAGNTAMQDSDLIKASPKLAVLNIRCNNFITRQSVTHLANLKILDIDNTDSVKIKDIHQLPKLQIVKFGTRQEIGDLFQLKDIHEVHYLSDYDESDTSRSTKQMMYIAEALFSLIDNNEELSNHSDLPIIKNKYEKRILLPYHYDLGCTKKNKNTTYPFNFETSSYTAKDLDYVHQLTKNKIEHSASVWGWENTWEKSTEIYEIIIDLIKITGKNLTIYVCSSNGIRSLEEIVEAVVHK